MPVGAAHFVKTLPFAKQVFAECSGASPGKGPAIEAAGAIHLAAEQSLQTEALEDAHGETLAGHEPAEALAVSLLSRRGNLHGQEIELADALEVCIAPVAQDGQ